MFRCPSMDAETYERNLEDAYLAAEIYCDARQTEIWGADLWLACCLAGLAARVAYGDWIADRGPVSLRECMSHCADRLGVCPWWEE